MHATLTSTITRTLAVIAGGLLTCGAHAGDPDAVFTGAVSADWFDPANWDIMAPPSASNAVVIEGGQTVEALAVNSGGQQPECADLEIGYLTSSSAIADGMVNSFLADTDLTVNGDVLVGRVNGGAGASQTTGRFFLFDATLSIVDGAPDFEVGVTAFNPDTTAFGEVGMLNATVTGLEDLEIGVAGIDGGASTGTMQVEGTHLSGNLVSVEVGRAIDSGGSAEGSLVLRDSSLTGGRDLDIGVSRDASAGAFGSVDLIGSYAEFQAEVTLDEGGLDDFDPTPGSAVLSLDSAHLACGNLWGGPGGTFEFRLRGGTRATPENAGDPGVYPAIDVNGTFIPGSDFGTAEIESIIVVSFGFTPNPGHTFDIITLTTPGEVFASPFGAFTFDGLPAGLGVELEVVPASAASGEILRVRVTGPSPCLADLNGDGILDLADIGIFTSGFLAGDVIADLDANGIFDLGDIGLFTQSFIAGCP